MTFSIHNFHLWSKGNFQALLGGGKIEVNRGSMGIWRSTSTLDLSSAEELVARHLSDSAVEDWLKPSGKRRVSRLSRQHTSYIVKEFARSWLPVYFRAACKSWVYSLFLEDFSPPCLGWLNSSKQGDFLIYRDAGKGNFWRAQYDHLSDVRHLYEKSGELLADLHLAGIYHSDTKPANFVRNQWIQESRREVFIVDCDHIVHFRRIPRKYQVKNLAQFLAGTGYTGNFRLWSDLVCAFIDAYQSRFGFESSELDYIMAEVCMQLNRPGIENNLVQLQQSTFDEELYRRMKYKIPIPSLKP